MTGAPSRPPLPHLIKPPSSALCRARASSNAKSGRETLRDVGHEFAENTH
jgi:hypothetical protein